MKLTALTLVFLGLFGFGLILWRRQSTDSVSIAASRLEEVHRKARAMGLPSTSTELLGAFPVQDADNAAPIVARMVQEIEVIKKAAHEFIETSTEPGAMHDYRFSAAALELAHAASQRSRYQPERKWDETDFHFSDLGEVTWAIKLLVRRAIVKARQHDFSGATQDIRAAYRLSVLSGDEPFMLSAHIRSALLKIVFRGIEHAASEFPDQEAFLSALTAVLDDPLETSAKRYLYGEVLISYSFCRNFERMGGLHALDDTEPAPMQSAPPRPIRSEGLPDVELHRAYLMRVLEFYMELMRIDEGHSVRARLLQTETLQESVKKMARQDESYRLLQYGPPFRRFVGLLQESEIHRRLILTLLRNVDYKAKHGRFAADPAMGQLDPFDGKPIRWKIERGTLILWSIGEDMIDHGGDTGPVGADIIVRFPFPPRKG